MANGRLRKILRKNFTKTSSFEFFDHITNYLMIRIALIVEFNKPLRFDGKGISRTRFNDNLSERMALASRLKIP